MNVNNVYFEQLDKLLKDDVKTITCSEMSDLYFSFGRNLKNLTGISANYTWLSEFLIFRYVYHYLCFNEGAILDENSRVQFQNNRDGLTLIPNKTVTVNGNTQVPDVVVMKNDSILRLISVKTTMLKVEEDFERISNIRAGVHSNFRSVTVTFDEMRNSTKLKMQEVELDYEWHKYISLKNEKHTFYSVLTEKLKLKEVLLQ
ncbi:hypothetical protein [Paenibacillus sp. Soil522]|uniref:hypothetical protein n=1 Tax=Paenibacillus sp. Soil522 TaxID=1736388 RepID=UPI0012DF5A9C|nr:hypothetical protein [Paenibacillus sp. Soil522]